MIFARDRNASSFISSFLTRIKKPIHVENIKRENNEDKLHFWKNDFYISFAQLGIT